LLRAQRRHLRRNLARRLSSGSWNDGVLWLDMNSLRARVGQETSGPERRTQDGKLSNEFVHVFPPDARSHSRAIGWC
jgi:hypothetical protein